MFWFLFGGVMISVAMLPVFLAMRWQRNRRRKRYFPVQKGMGWLQWTAIWLLLRLPPSLREHRWLKGQAKAAADRLNPGANTESFCLRHQIQKMMLVYGGILLSLCLLLLYGCVNREPKLADNCIQREAAQGNSREVTIEAEVEGVEEKNGNQTLTLSIRPRQYTEDERTALMERVKAYIDRNFIGNNESSESVCEPLCLMTDFPGENVTIEWQTEDYNLIHADGTLGDLTMYQLPVRTTMTAVIHYGNYELPYEKSVQIVEKDKTEKEIWHDLLTAAVSAADDDSVEAMSLKLPEIIDGHTVRWRYQHDSMWPGLAALALCLIGCCVWYQEERLKKQLEQRTEQLLCDYPVFVHRMVLMLGAGMTVRRSLEQLLKDYEKDHGSDCRNVYLYKELKYASLQMQAGMPETQVYMNFGRRTELSQYMKFSQLLIQFIRRGSKGMQEMMLQEACEAEKQRRDLAKRLSETAGTKLLLPMMLLLVIVLVIVMVPAFLSM